LECRARGEEDRVLWQGYDALPEDRALDIADRNVIDNYSWRLLFGFIQGQWLKKFEEEGE
jgi:hypothetical protein